MSYLGELAAILAALTWTINSLVIEKLGRGFSSWAINFLGKSLGLLGVSLLAFTLSGSILPGANARQWALLLLSGVIGFSLGDGFLFTAFQRLGAKRTLLIFSANPIITAILGWFLLGESLRPMTILGTLLAVTGIMIVILGDVPNSGRKGDIAGLISALLATLGQSAGMLLSKSGMQGLDAVSAAQIRLVGGTLGIMLILSVMKKWGGVRPILHSPNGRKVISANVFLGTLIGMVLSMLAIKMTRVAVASILTSLMPVMILPVSAVFMKEKITLRETAGAVITVLGVSLLFV